MQLTGKLEVTGTRISERLDDVTSLVDRSIDKFNGEMERMLSNRREVLDNLICGNLAPRRRSRSGHVQLHGHDRGITQCRGRPFARHQPHRERADQRGDLPASRTN
jgi:hypothetical protein